MPKPREEKNRKVCLIPGKPHMFLLNELAYELLPTTSQELQEIDEILKDL